MTVLTGASGALQFNGTTVGCVRDWSLNISRDAVDTTCLSKFDRTYVPGLRGATGSATVLYDPVDTAAVNMLNSIFKNTLQADSRVSFVLNTANQTGINAEVLLTSVSPSVSVGEAQASSVNFQITGPMSGNF